MKETPFLELTECTLKIYIPFNSVEQIILLLIRL